MARHAHYRFPCNSIVKVGLRHGPYHFKKMIDASKYNKFNLFLMTSETEVKVAKKLGIKNVVSGGFPKLDSLLDSSISSIYLDRLSKEINLDKNKKTLLFSATWDDSKMSAIDKWINKLSTLTNRFNILVTVHPFTNEGYKKILRKNFDITFIGNCDLYPYMKISDALISDTSSIIAEYCSLYKPIICFKTPDTKRTESEVQNIIESISLTDGDFDELIKNIDNELANPEKRKSEQIHAVKIFFDDDKPDKGEKTSKIIMNFLQ
jgi:CDP-glycerol glycerophosphotransferase (TagB/SpsB family)